MGLSEVLLNINNNSKNVFMHGTAPDLFGKAGVSIINA